MKGFAKLTKYQDHMSKHSEEKPNECIECGAKFKQESGLRAHVQIEHSTEEARLMFKLNQAKKMNTQQLLCHICGYCTTSRSYYKTHMNIHKGVKPYRYTCNSVHLLHHPYVLWCTQVLSFC